MTGSGFHHDMREGGVLDQISIVTMEILKETQTSQIIQRSSIKISTSQQTHTHSKQRGLYNYSFVSI